MPDIDRLAHAQGAPRVPAKTPETTIWIGKKGPKPIDFYLIGHLRMFWSPSDENDAEGSNTYVQRVEPTGMVFQSRYPWSEFILQRIQPNMAIVRKFGKPNPCPTVQISFDKSFGSRKNHWWISSPEFWIVAPADSGVASGREILPTVTPCTVGVHPGGPWDGQVPTASLKVWKSHWVNMDWY